MENIAILTMRTKREEQTFKARITSIEPRTDEHGIDFEYIGYVPDDRRLGRWGYTRWYGPGVKEWGLVSFQPCAS